MCLSSRQFNSLPRGTYSPHYGFSRSRLAHIQLFSTSARFDGGSHWDALELSPHSRRLRAPSLPIFSFLRLCRLSHLQEGELFSRCKGQRSVAHQWYSPSSRTVLQGALGCCGWSGPLHGAAASGTCYPRSPLPGCHGPLMRFERDVLSSVAGTVFSLVPLYLVNIFVGLLCANHVTHRFGKGITPARYRLTAHDIFLSAGSAAAPSSSSAVDTQGDMKQTNLPGPPVPAPKGHSTFREDRQCVTTYRHARAKCEFEREV